MFKKKVPLRHRRHVWPWVLGVSVIFLVISIYASDLLSTEFVIAAVSGLLGTAFFLHRGHAEDARFMKELFQHFNNRYDQLNNELLAVLDKPESPLSEDEKKEFIDYFNLCAEEWVFRQAGYIYDPVWQSWEKGMLQYRKNHHVAALWEKEEQTNSYYGFKFPTE